MRVTLQMSSMNSIYNVNSNTASMYSLSEDISTGYSVTNLSDDPSAAVTAISDTATISKLNTYLSNIEIADTIMGLTDNSLSDVNEILTSAKELAVDMSSGENTEDMFTGSLAEMTELLASLVNVANSDYSGQYLFAGTDYTEEPFEIVADKYVYFTGNNDDLEVATDSGTYTAMNTTAEDAFGNLETTITTATLERSLNISSSNSTPLDDLNDGEGVAEGSITVYYSSAPASLGGLTIDLSDADTLEDVASYIEQASIDKADSFESTDPEYNYILQVDLNEDKTGLVITQIDRTTGLAVDLDTDTDATGISIKDTETARNLGISGTGTTSGDSTLSGSDLDPIITNTTLLSDLTNWDDNSLTIYNGSEDNSTTAVSSGDASEYFSSWQLTGLSEDGNITDDTKLYYQMTDLGTGDWEVCIYNDENCTSNSLVATGTSDGGLLTFEEVNDSGVSGTVSFAPPSSASDPIDGVLTIDYPTSFSSNIDVYAFELDGAEIGSSGIDTDDLISSLNIYGLEKGVTTDDSGDFEVVIDYNASGTYDISIVSDGNVMLTGTLASGSSGVVELEAATGYEDLSGTITLDCPSSIMTTGSYSVDATATFNTIEDVTNAINSSSTYTTSQISDDGSTIEISSQLCGAYLTIAENYSGAAISGDDSDQLSCLNLNGVVAGVNSDEDGKLYASVTETEVDATAGTYTYSINFYSDADMTELVAQAESDTTDGEIQITAVDDSNLSGTVYLSYSADDTSIEVTSTPLTAENDELDQISQIDLTGLISGQNCGYDGELYFEIENVSGTNYVRAYSDSDHENLVASGSISGSGVVTISEENYSGISGSLYLDYQSDDSDIVVSEKSTDVSGRDQEQNIFSTFASLIDAMTAEDCYAVNDQLENLEDDLTRVLEARATVGSKQNTLEMLSTRHTSNIDIYEEAIANAIEVDLVEASTEYAEQKTAYEASLEVTSQLMSMSLLNYL